MFGESYAFSEHYKLELIWFWIAALLLWPLGSWSYSVPANFCITRCSSDKNLAFEFANNIHSWCMLGKISLMLLISCEFASFWKILVSFLVYSYSLVNSMIPLSVTNFMVLFKIFIKHLLLVVLEFRFKFVRR